VLFNSFEAAVNKRTLDSEAKMKADLDKKERDRLEAEQSSRVEEMKKAVLTAEKEGGWLVFAGHEIGGTAFQTTRTDSLEQFVKYAQDPANGVWLETVKTVARYVQTQRASR